MSTDEAKKQYFIFSIIITLILSFIINFFLSGSLNGPIVSGFPFSVVGIEGFTSIFYRLINTIVMTLLLVVPVYYGLMWLITRGNGGNY